MWLLCGDDVVANGRPIRGVSKENMEINVVSRKNLYASRGLIYAKLRDRRFDLVRGELVIFTLLIRGVWTKWLSDTR